VDRPLLSRRVRGVTTPDTRPVRAGEELEWPRLEAWLRERLPASCLPGPDEREPMRVAQFPGGHSNLTYRVRFGGTELVVRRPDGSVAVESPRKGVRRRSSGRSGASR